MRSKHLMSFVLVCALSSVSFAACAADTGRFDRHEMTGGFFVEVGEHMYAPPADPPGTATPQPTGRTLQAQVVADLRKRFDAAADPSTHLLSLAQAKGARWGYIVDHFQQIDRSGNGRISFADLLAYLKSKNGPAVSS